MRCFPLISLKEYIITLVSVFLALGIGIIVGTSITESVVVEQQMSIIEELEARYFTSLEEKEELMRANKKKDTLLELWDAAAWPLALYDGKDELKGQEVGVISLDRERGQEICDFLTDKGLTVNPHIYSTEDGLDEERITAMFAMSKTLLKTHHNPFQKEKPPHAEGVTWDVTYPARPGTFLVVGGGIALGRAQAARINEGIQEMGEVTFVALEDYFANGSFLNHLSGMEITGIDFIDTTAGKIALLKFLQGKEGPFTIKPLSK